MQFRDHEAVKGKRDAYPVDPRFLKIDPTYNVRDMKDPETIAHVRWLADSIKEVGVKMPLTVRLVGEDIYVVAGHCRHAATMLAISEGAEILTVPTMPEPKGTSEVDRVLDLVVSNSGKPLSALAIAEVVRRLVAFGWDNSTIAKKLGWKTVTMVDQSLALLSAPAEVQQMVRDGSVSATTAVKVFRADGGDKAKTTLRAALAVAKASGKNKVTDTTVRKAKGEFNPSPANVKLLVEALLYTARYADRKTKANAIKVLGQVGIPFDEEETAEQLLVKTLEPA